MVSRSEIDLFNIRKEFKETHDVSLHEFIQVETMIVSSSPCLLTLVWFVYRLIFIYPPSVVLEFCVFVMSMSVLLLHILFLLLWWGGGIQLPSVIDELVRGSLGISLLNFLYTV